MSEDTTQELLRRAQAGDEEGLRLLIERYGPRLLERIRRMMGRQVRRAAESGDFLQEVMLRVVKHLDRFEVRDEQSFLRWAVRIARHAIIDEERRRRERGFRSLSVELRISASMSSPPSECARREEMKRLAELLAQLPEDHRRVLELRHLDGLSFRAIGQRMARSENAAQLLHAKALTMLGGLWRRRK